MAGNQHPVRKSRVTNGNALFFNKSDEENVWSRRFRDVMELHISDLGGRESCSEAQLSLARRAAAMTVALEGMEAAAALKPDEFDIDCYGRATGNLRRVLESLGLKRTVKEVPDLHDYIGGEGARPS